MKKTLFCKALLAALAVSTAASAQTLGREHDVTLGFERLFGFYWNSWSRDNGPTDEDGSGFNPSIGWNRGNAYYLPRVAVDFFVIERLSIGGALGFYDHEGGDNEGFLFAPRVGYAIDLSSKFALWPRGGVSYYSEGDFHQFALSGEAQFVFLPQPSWGIMFGPTLDLGLTGTDGRNANNDDNDFNEHALGISFGGVGIF